MAAAMKTLVKILISAARETTSGRAVRRNGARATTRIVAATARNGATVKSNVNRAMAAKSVRDMAVTRIAQVVKSLLAMAGILTLLAAAMVSVKNHPATAGTRTRLLAAVTTSVKNAQVMVTLTNPVAVMEVAKNHLVTVATRMDLAAAVADTATARVKMNMVSVGSSMEVIAMVETMRVMVDGTKPLISPS